MNKETVDSETLSSLSTQWGKIFQKSTLLVETEEPHIPIVKPIKNSWLPNCFIAAFLMMADYYIMAKASISMKHMVQIRTKLKTF